MFPSSSSFTGSFPRLTDPKEEAMYRFYARRRDIEHSSSDSSDSGTFLISNVESRVATLPAKPLPLASWVNEACWKAQQLFKNRPGNKSLSAEVSEISARYGVEPLDIDVYARFILGDEAAVQKCPPTVLIVAKWDELSSKTWEAIVRDVKKLVDKVDASASLSIGVEMIDVWHTQEKYPSPVPLIKYPSTLRNDWELIRSKALDILDLYDETRHCINIMSLIIYGTNRDARLNDLTLHIALGYESKESGWPRVRSNIKTMLEKFPYPIHVRFEYNDLSEFYPFDFKKWDKPDDGGITTKRGFKPTKHQYHHVIVPGDDIGAAGYIEVPGDNNRPSQKVFPGGGTVGCWVEITTTTEKKWKPYILTNYHVVRPAVQGFQLAVKDSGNMGPGIPVQNSPLEQADLKGITPLFQGLKFDIESPTRRTHSYAVHALEDLIREKPDNVAMLKRKLKENKEFFDKGKHIVGSVFLASGFARRTDKNGRLDWALIKPTDGALGRAGKNELPGLVKWQERGYVAEVRMRPYASATVLKYTDAKTLKKYTVSDNVWKVGAATGPTGGPFQCLRSSVRLGHDSHLVAHFDANPHPESNRAYLTEEYACYVMAGKDTLSSEGDSGSVCFDEWGNAVGLLFRGQSGKRGNEHCYVTPIEDVFNDIVAFADGVITGIRIKE